MKQLVILCIFLHAIGLIVAVQDLESKMSFQYPGKHTRQNKCKRWTWNNFQARGLLKPLKKIKRVMCDEACEERH